MKPQKINARDKKGFEIIKKTKKAFDDLAILIINNRPDSGECKPEQR